MLDEALDARHVNPGPDDDLAQRIYQATADRVRSRWTSAVIARIGRSRLTSLAAMLLVAAWAGILGLSASITHDARQIMAVRADLKQLQQPTAATLPIDEEIESLSAQIQTYQTSQFWSQEIAWLDEAGAVDDLSDEASVF